MVAWFHNQKKYELLVVFSALAVVIGGMLAMAKCLSQLPVVPPLFKASPPPQGLLGGWSQSKRREQTILCLFMFCS